MRDVAEATIDQSAARWVAEESAAVQVIRDQRQTPAIMNRAFSVAHTKHTASSAATQFVVGVRACVCVSVFV